MSSSIQSSDDQENDLLTVMTERQIHQVDRVAGEVERLRLKTENQQLIERLDATNRSYLKVKAERATDAEELQRLRKGLANAQGELKRIRDEKEATAEAKKQDEIYRSTLERALEDELASCRRQLENTQRVRQTETLSSRERERALQQQTQDARLSAEHTQREIEMLKRDHDETEKARGWLASRLNKTARNLQALTDQHLMLKAFRGFLVNSNHNNARRMYLTCVLNQQETALSVRCLGAWHLWVRERHAHSATLQRCDARRDLALLTTTMHDWYHTMHDQMLNSLTNTCEELARELDEAQARASSRAYRQGFHFAARRKLSALASSLDVWSQAVNDKKAASARNEDLERQNQMQLETQRKALYRILKLEHSKAFEGFVEAVHRARQERRILVKAALRMLMLRQARAFGCFRERIDRQRHIRASVSTALGRWTRMSLVRGWCAWQEYSAQREFETKVKVHPSRYDEMCDCLSLCSLSH